MNAPKVRWENCPACQKRIKDEGLKDEHELQSWFITRMEKYLNAHGRQIIGWDEILEGGLAPEATVMSWRGVSGAIEAARMGHDAIMTPTGFAYLDYYQSEPAGEPLSIGDMCRSKRYTLLNLCPKSLPRMNKNTYLAFRAMYGQNI
jgi:hexosaminidase